MRAPCSIDGCDKESRGRGWCSTHWLRWRTHGDPLIVLRLGVDYQVKQPCSVDDCDTLAKAHGYCNKHLGRWRKSGDPLVVGAKTGRPWKGTQPSWGAVHRRIERSRGKASAFSCVDCLGPAAEWSYDGGDPDELTEVLTPGGQPLAYSTDLSHYVPRCVPCHRRHDAAARTGKAYPDIALFCPYPEDVLDVPGVVIRLSDAPANRLI